MCDKPVDVIQAKTTQLKGQKTTPSATTSDRVMQKHGITWSAKEQRRRQADVEKLRRWLAWVDTLKTGVTFPGLQEGNRQAEEFLSIVRKMVTR